jgi:hemerythrin
MNTWNQEFETGIKEIDSSNRALLFEIQSFYESTFKEKNTPNSPFVFEMIVFHAGIKFNNEILIYQEYGYNEHLIIEHAKMHNSIIYIFEKAMLDYKKGNLFNLNSFANYLNLSIMEHIITCDKEIGRYITHHQSVALTVFS